MKMNESYTTTLFKLIWELEYQADKNDDIEVKKMAKELKILFTTRNEKSKGEKK